MIKRSSLKKLMLFLSISSTCSYSYAGTFQQWGLDAISIGNYHAERAAITEDASTAYYNPAGLIAIKNQEMIGGIAPTMTDLRFRGSESVNTLPITGPQTVSAQGGSYKLYPFLHYAAPLNDYFVFGFSIVQPFGYKTNYGNSTLIRYSSSLNTFDVYDFTPSLGIAFTSQFSLGLGFDFERLSSEFDYYTSAPGQVTDTVSTNSGNDWACGYHLGALYQFTSKTRVGIAYQSQLSHRLSGTSQYNGPLAGGVQLSSLRMRMMLPPTTTLSAFHSFNSQWDLMASASLTQWTVTNNTVLNNVSGISSAGLTNHLQVPLVQGYRNSWNYGVGANYHINDTVTLRTGIGYDETPTTNASRNVQIPDSNKVAVAFGAHIQATNTMGFDAGWTHLFYSDVNVNYAQSAGIQTATSNGSIQQNTDVYGIQAKWDIL